MKTRDAKSLGCGYSSGGYVVVLMWHLWLPMIFMAAFNGSGAMLMERMEVTCQDFWLVPGKNFGILFTFAYLINTFL